MKRGYNIVLMNSQTIPSTDLRFPSTFIAYSTVEIEKSIFFGPKSGEQALPESDEKVTMLVVHGEMYQLVNEAPPISVQLSSDRPAMTEIVSLDCRES